MRTATAQYGRASERTAHKIAEKMAKNAGVDFDDWIAEAIAEYAADLGVDPQDLNERERLEAIEERIDRLARSAPAPVRPAPEGDDPPQPSSREAANRFAARGESLSRRLDEPENDQREARRRVRRAAETEPAELDPLEQAVTRIERRSHRAPEREGERTVRTRDRLEGAIQEIERRAERSERRAARALESLSSLIEARSEDSGRLEETIQEIEKRADRSERRAAQALESLAGLVEAHGGENERLQRAIAEADARADKTAARTARALETLSGAVEARKADRDRLEAAIARIGRRAEQSEARAARALESLATQVPQPAAEALAPEREDPVAARLEALARRAARTPEPAVAKPNAAPTEDDETFRLVAERLARRRRERQDAAPEPPRADSAPEPAKSQAAADPAVADMQRQLRRLADKVDTFAPPQEPTSSVESAEKDSAVLRIERQLASLAERIERLAQPAPNEARVEPAARFPSLDSRPLEELARRVEAIRAAIERQSAARPDGSALLAALANLNDKLDRAAAGGAQSAATMAALHGLIGRLEEASQHPKSAALDPRPIEDLARRIDGVRGLMERQSGLAPKVDEITVAVGELQQKLPRAAATTAEIERVEAGLRQLSAEVQALGRAQPVDMRPVEALGRRIEEMGKAVESRQGLAPEVERLEEALAEIRVRLERPAQSPQIEAVDATLRKLAAKFEEAVNRPAHDPRPIEDLSRRIDAVRSAAERGFAPHAARLDAALADIRAQFDKPTPEVDAALRDLAAKVEDAISRPATVSLDPRPIEELARRIESVRESLDRPPALAPQVERLESALGAVAERLERAQPIIDTRGINSTLAAMNARLEEAFRQPRQVEIDREPIEALAARVDAVRETVERQSEQLDEVGRPIDELGRRLETLCEAIERQSEQLDGERLEDALRGAAQKLGRLGAGQEEFRAIVSAIQALAAKIDHGASAIATARVEDLMERVTDRLDRPSVEFADAIADLTAKMERPVPDLARLEALMEQASARLDPPADLASVAEAIAELSARLDRESNSPRAALIEDLVQDVAARLDGIESKLDVRSGKAAPSGEGLAQLELGMRELAKRIGDFGGAAQELRAVQDRLDDLEPLAASGALVEQTVQAIAHDLAARLPAANPEALLGHLQDIHERLDAISASRPGPAALEQTMIELTEELEALRSARETVGRGAATLSEMRAEQLQFDRRMDARFVGVQEILEKLVEKIDRDPEAEPLSALAPASSPGATSRAAMLDIPDRSAGERRPIAAPSLDAPQIPAQGRGREAAEGNNAKAAAINAHIAAARRAASAATADGERREDVDQVRRTAQNESGGLTQRAATLFSQHRRPVLLGAAGVMTLLTGVAVLEMRGHAPLRKSELEAPAAPLAQAELPTEQAVTDTTPTGAIPAPAKVIAAPLPPPKAEAASKPEAALVAALPAGLGAALAAAGSNGDIGAEVEIAQRYLEGRGVPRDPKAAAGWMQAAADAGSAFARYRLGAMYEKGVGVGHDSARARELYKMAADAGNARAMHNLAVLYAQDGGAGKPDYAAAIEWFRKAGAYGVRDSQFNLGVLYGRGFGASQDLAQSWMWFSLAARQGDPDAAKKRDEVENRMDGRALTEAKKLLDEFKTKTPEPAANNAPPVPAAAASATPADAKPAGVRG
jgi:localization factor PodJL